MKSLVSTLFKRSTLMVTSFVLAVSSLSAAMPLFLSQNANAIGGNVNLANMNGWSINTKTSNGAVESGGLVNFISDGGVGAAQFLTTSDNNSRTRLYHPENVNLSDVSDISYIAKQVSAVGPSSHVAFHLHIDADGNSATTNDTFQLTYEPYWQDSLHAGDPAPIVANTWQPWNVKDGIFWASIPSGNVISGLTNGAGGPPFYSLSDVLSLHSTALVTGIDIGTGTYNPSVNALVDRLTFNGDTYDFQATPSITHVGPALWDGLNYKGIDVSISADKVVDATGLSVIVNRSDGSTVTKTAKTTGGVLGIINTGNPATVSAPIVIQNGTYIESASSSWNPAPASWTSSTVPLSVTVIINLSDGGIIQRTEPVTGPAEYLSLLPPDTAKPTVSNISISPTVNSNIGRTVTVTFDLNDATGIDLTKTKVLFADGPNVNHKAKESAKFTPVLVPGSSNTYQVVVDTTNFLNQNYIGNYTLAFNLYDTLGNHGSTKPISFRSILIDNSGPSATLVNPISGSVVNNTQRFTFNITDDTQVASAYVKFNGPTSKQLNLTHGSGDEWYVDVDTTTMNDGTYTLDVRPTDVFGTARYNANRGQVVVDNTTPVVSIDSPTGSLFNTDVQVKGSVTDPHLRHYWLNIKKDGVNIVNSTVLSSSFTNTLLATLTQEGDYVVTLAARDSAGGGSSTGNRSADVVKSFTIDKTAPAEPTNLQWLTGSNPTITNNPTVTPTWTDNDTDVDHYEYQYKKPNEIWRGAPTTPGYTIGVSQAKPNRTLNKQGTWLFQVRAVDAAGNKSQWVQSDPIIFDSIVPVVPTALLTANSVNVPDNGITNSSTFTFNLGSSSDVTRYQLKYWNDIAGSSFKVGTEWNPSDLSGYSSSLGVYNDQFTQGNGIHHFAFSACDAANNCSAYSTPYSVTYDNVAPDVSIDPLSTTDTLPTITGTVGLDAVNLTVEIDGTPLVVTRAGTTWSAPVISALNVGNHTVVAIATDLADNFTNVNQPLTVTQVVTPATDTTPATTTTTTTTTGTPVVTTGPTTPGGEVLGDQTTNEDAAKADDSKTNPSASILGDATSNPMNLFGLAWYWWLAILAAIIAAWWIIAAALRRRDNQNL